MLYGMIRKYLIKAKLLVLILIFLENALRPSEKGANGVINYRLNPYFFGKCSTAAQVINQVTEVFRLNPYFFGKCSTATPQCYASSVDVLCLNPYFFGKCSTASIKTTKL